MPGKKRLTANTAAVPFLLPILQADRFDDQLYAVELEMKRIQTRPYHERGGDDEKRLDMIELNRKVVGYLRNFSPEDTILDLLQLGTLYKIMGDMDLSDVE